MPFGYQETLAEEEVFGLETSRVDGNPAESNEEIEPALIETQEKEESIYGIDANKSFFQGNPEAFEKYRRLVSFVEQLDIRASQENDKERLEILSISWQYVQNCKQVMFGKKQAVGIDKDPSNINVNVNVNIKSALLDAFGIKENSSERDFTEISAHKDNPGSESGAAEYKQYKHETLKEKTCCVHTRPTPAPPPPPPAPSLSTSSAYVRNARTQGSLNKLFPCKGFGLRRPPPMIKSKRPRTIEHLFLTILSYLDAQSLVRMNQVCLGCHHFCGSNRYKTEIGKIWNNICLSAFGSRAASNKHEKIDPKTRYQLMCNNSRLKNILFYGSKMAKKEVIEEVYKVAIRFKLNVLEVGNQVRTKMLYSKNYWKPVWCAAKCCAPCIILISHLPATWIPQDQKTEAEMEFPFTQDVEKAVRAWEHNRAKKGTQTLAPLSRPVWNGDENEKNNRGEKSKCPLTQNDFFSLFNQVAVDIVTDEAEGGIVIATLAELGLDCQIQQLFGTKVRLRMLSNLPSRDKMYNELRSKLELVDHDLDENDIERLIRSNFGSEIDADKLIQAAANSFLKRLQAGEYFRLNELTKQFELCTVDSTGSTKYKLSDLPLSSVRHGPITLADFSNASKSNHKQVARKMAGFNEELDCDRMKQSKRTKHYTLNKVKAFPVRKSNTSVRMNSIHY